MIDIKKDLITAKNYKDEGNYRQALEYFEKAYNANSEAFKEVQKQDYAWTIYRVKVQNFKNEAELLKSAEFITKIISQLDLNEVRNCPYTAAVFKVLNHLEGKDYFAMLPWIEKLDYTLLDEKPYYHHNRWNKSKKEKFLDWASIVYLKTGELEKCMQVSKIGLNTFETFFDEGDVWFKWRIAKSLMELNQLRQSLEYYLEVIEVKHEWYMYRDIAQMYYDLGKKYVALDYICPAVLSEKPNSVKVNLYYLCYKVFKSFNPEMALKHAQLFKLLKSEKGYSIPSEIEDLDIDVSELNKRELEDELHALWTQYKFKDQKKQHGEVVNFSNDRKFGFIRSENDESIFFHKNEFNEDNVYVGQLVSFYTEENFSNVKNEKSVKAVNVRGE